MYTIQKILEQNGIVHYRITDSEDNRIATCYVLENAELVVKALNAFLMKEDT